MISAARCWRGVRLSCTNSRCPCVYALDRSAISAGRSACVKTRKPRHRNPVRAIQWGQYTQRLAIKTQGFLADILGAVFKIYLGLHRGNVIQSHVIASALEPLRDSRQRLLVSPRSSHRVNFPIVLVAVSRLPECEHPTNRFLRLLFWWSETSSHAYYLDDRKWSNIMLFIILLYFARWFFKNVFFCSF